MIVYTDFIMLVKKAFKNGRNNSDLKFLHSWHLLSVSAYKFLSMIRINRSLKKNICVQE